MRRGLSILLVLSLLLSAAACSAKRDARINPITFYYQKTEIGYGTDDGVIYGLSVDLEDRSIAISDVISQYLEGPDDDFLQSPFPPDTKLQEVRWEDGLLRMTLSNEFQNLSGLDTGIAMACLTLTLTQITGVEQISVQTEDGQFSYRDGEPLKAADFQVQDLSGSANEISVNLYFADEKSRYLLLDSRKIQAPYQEQLPAEIMKQLLAGPKLESMYSAIPVGTQLRSAVLENGVCTVDLSYEFIENRPGSALTERAAVFSIVNTLTELEPVTAVQITVEGQIIDAYGQLNLSKPVVRNERTIGPIRSGLNEFDGTIYLYSPVTDLLVGVPMRLRCAASQTKAEVLLNALLQTGGEAGLRSAIPAETRVQSLHVEDGRCSVDFSEEFRSVCGNKTAERAAVRAVVATLCKLTEIRRVQITIDGSSEGFFYCDITEPIMSQLHWSAS